MTKSSRKDFDRLDPILKDKARVVMESIALQPLQGKKLKGKLDGHYSVRAWPFRIVYEIRKTQLLVVVLAIRHRKDAYR